jgi:mRNA interferase MazF
MSKPVRGEVWMADLGLKAKVRPVLVLSVAFRDDERALVTVIPHTTVPRGTRYEVPVRAYYLHKAGAFDPQQIVSLEYVDGTTGRSDRDLEARSGAFAGEALTSIPYPKFERRLGRLQLVQLADVEERVRLWLGLIPSLTGA